jgi:histidinol dehydrogenase
VGDPDEVLPFVRSAGAVFLGGYSPEPLGDYLAGPDHVLPTMGTARFFSALSVDTFLKKISLIRYTKDMLFGVKDDILTLANTEGLTAHAAAVAIRFPENKGEKP